MLKFITLGSGRVQEQTSHLESRFDEAPELLSLDGHVVFGQPVAVQDRPAQRVVSVQVREVLHGDKVHILVRPLPLFIFHKSGDKQHGEHAVGSGRTTSVRIHFYTYLFEL